MTDDHVDHFFIEGRAVTENPDAVAGALHGGLEAVAGSRAMIVAETGAEPEPSAWVRSRNMQRAYDRELTALKSPGGKGSKAKAAAVARAKDEEHVRERALARTRKAQEYAEQAHRHSAGAESLLGNVDDVPGALESLAQAKASHEAALRVLEINREALSSLVTRRNS